MTGALRYVYPEVSTRNFGDYVIDYAVRSILGRHLPAPSASCDTFTGSYPAGAYQCLLIPGITHLTVGACPGLARIGALPYPTYCLSGNIWTAPPPRGVLLRSRVLHRHPLVDPDLSLARLMASPIGARDRSTYNLLTRHGLPALYTGCATLFLPPDEVADDGYVLFSLGRGHVRTQTRLAHGLARRHHVVGIAHETDDLALYHAAGWRLPLVTYQGDIQLYLSYFQRASLVVTGRLHGALPALAYGKKVFLFGTRDSRTSICDDLGLPIHDYADVPQAVERASGAFNRRVLPFFQDNWLRLFEAIHTGVATQGVRTP